MDLESLVEWLFWGSVSNTSALWGEVWELGKRTHYLYELRLLRAPACSLCCLVLVAIYISSRPLSFELFFNVMGKGGFAKPGLFISEVIRRAEKWRETGLDSHGLVEIQERMGKKMTVLLSQSCRGSQYLSRKRCLMAL